MIKTFYIINIISLLLYIPGLFVHMQNTSSAPYLNVLFLLFVAMLFLSLRVVATVVKRFAKRSIKTVFGYFITVFPLIFPLSGVFLSAYLDDKRQMIPYIAFQVYYFIRFYPVLKQMEVYHYV